MLLEWNGVGARPDVGLSTGLTSPFLIKFFELAAEAGAHKDRHSHGPLVGLTNKLCCA